MAWYDFIARIGRPPHQAKRETVAYAKLMQIGGQTYSRDRPMIKPTPANLRRFAKTVYARRAIKTVKDPISLLDWEIAPKEGVDLNPELKRQIETVTACFRSPNRDDSFSTLIEQIVEDMLICGAGAVEQQLGGDLGRPLWLWPVDALSIQIYAAWDGSPTSPRYCQALGFGNVGTTQGRQLRNDELLYIRVDPSTETPFGLGAIEVAFSTINRLLGAQAYAGNVASNASPQSFLFFEGLDADSINAIRAYWRNEVEGQGNAPIFGGNAKPVAVPVRGANDEALFLKFQEVLAREVFAAVGVSPQNAGIEADVNRNTAEVSEDRDWRMTIIPMARRVAMHLNREVIEARLGFSQIEFKWLGLDREDEKASADIYKIMYEGNAITPNQERTRLNKPPLDNEWADMTYADMQIAVKAAQGAATIEDDNFDQRRQSKSASQTPKTSKGR